MCGGERAQGVGALVLALGAYTHAHTLTPRTHARTHTHTHPTHAGERRVKASEFFLGYRKTDMQPHEILYTVGG